MLTYALDQRRGLPLYEYLYQCIREDILSGVLTAGERLPSKRHLAEHLRISVITVEGAYQQLAAEGYIYTLPKRGFFVSHVEQVSAPDHPPPRLPQEERTKVWRLDLRSNHVDVSRFPVSVWSKLTRRVLSEDGTALSRPVPHQGLPALRTAIARELRDFKGMSVDPEQIVVGAGAEYLYILLAQLLAEEKSPVTFAVEDPGYPKIRQVYAKCGVSCCPAPLDAQGLCLDALETSEAIAAHLSPSHHYPTGLITPIGRRQALLRWAQRRGGYLIEDDYDSEFRFSGRPIPTLQSIDRSGRVIYMNTFSQTISPSMRIGFLVLPPALLERYRRELGFYTCTVPALEQYVLAHFLDGGYYEQHLSRMKKEYRSRRAAVLEAFQTLPGQVSEQGAGLHFLLHLDTDRSDAELQHRAEALGIRLGFLSEYAAVPKPAYEHTLVVNYASLDAAALPEALSLLQTLLGAAQGVSPPAPPPAFS